MEALIFRPEKHLYIVRTNQVNASKLQKYNDDMP